MIGGGEGVIVVVVAVVVDAVVFVIAAAVVVVVLFVEVVHFVVIVVLAVVVGAAFVCLMVAKLCASDGRWATLSAQLFNMVYVESGHAGNRNTLTPEPMPHLPYVHCYRA